MPWFVKIEAGKVDKPTFDQYVAAHKAYVQDLITKGHKARTGYWAEFGGGMMLFEAKSMDEAQAIVALDPLVQNGCVNYQLHEWRIVVE
ncbi:MAG: YciI family protein [Aulosira sp. ZfuVER01]|nr:YciI family protein [Aulosira sp. ZfuVER01]MDZ7996573.1 YciI family protein [Aulosira sp. DedVER01a]MDZ8054484.1 YciI family protein [Aulosira sp. ZfuCHP01]